MNVHWYHLKSAIIMYMKILNSPRPRHLYIWDFFYVILVSITVVVGLSITAIIFW